MKKTLLATSIAALSACSQVDTSTVLQDPNSKADSSNELANPFMAASTNGDNLLESTGDTAQTSGASEQESKPENETSSDDSNEQRAQTESDEGKKVVTENGGWVMFSNEPLKVSRTNVDHVTNVEVIVDTKPIDVVHDVIDVSDDDNNTSQDDDYNALPVKFEILVEGKFSGITSQQLVIVRDQAAFDQIWQEHLTNPNAPSEQPVVDFNSEMVIGVFRGAVSNCTESLRVDRLLESDTINIHASLFTGDPNVQCLLPQQDFVMIKIAQSDKIVNLRTSIVAQIYVEPSATDKLKTKIELLNREIVEAIGSAECTYDAQCATIAVGAKACGFSQEFLAYSTYNTNVGYLTSLAQAQQHLSQELNQASGLLSDCLFVTEPVVSCRVNQCGISSSSIPTLPIQ